MGYRKIKWLRRFFRQQYTIRDFNSLRKISESELRSSSKIVIIDDEIDKMQTIIKTLRNNGFNISERHDITVITDIEPYDIVISDVQGVGRNIDKEEEGYGLIRQIAKLYPHKGIGVYSGISYTLKAGIEGMMVIQKDDSTQTWIENLDAKLKEIKDPSRMWRWMAKKLNDEGVPSIHIAKVEDDYVDRIINNKSMEGFPSDDLGDENLMGLLGSAAKMMSLGVNVARYASYI